MTLLLIAVISVCVSAGILLLLSRELFRVVMGLAMLGMSANLILFLSSRPGSLIPAVIEAGETALQAGAANPLPQALLLTAIVIGFALLCFSLVLAAAVTRQQGHTDVAAYRDSEPTSPANDQSNKPTIMEAE